MHITSEMVFDFMDYYNSFHKLIVMILVIINNCFILLKFCINIQFSGYAVLPVFSMPTPFDFNTFCSHMKFMYGFVVFSIH